MTELSTFSFVADEQTDLSHDVRVIDRDGSPWFVLRDVLKAMGSNTAPNNAKSSIINGLGDGYSIGIPIQDSLGRQQTVTVISEPAVTFLVSRSNTERGRKLNQWIHTEVIPAIREDGFYEAPTCHHPAPERPVTPSSVHIAGELVHVDRQGRYKLNHIQRAYERSTGDSARRRTPLMWIDAAEAQAAIESVQDCTHLRGNDLLYVVNGTNHPGTYGHRLVAVEYAHWLDQAFGARVERAIAAAGVFAEPDEPQIYTVPQIELSNPQIAAAVTALTELDLAQQELHRCQQQVSQRLAAFV